MNTAESAQKKKSYLHKLVRGETYFDPFRLIGYIAERIGRKIQSGTIFKRKLKHYEK